MPTVRCDRCNAVCSDAEVRDGWCENCGKRLPDYLLRPAKDDHAADAPPAEADDPGDREVEFRPALGTRVTASLFLSIGPTAALVMSVWTVTHMPEDPRKRTEAVVAAAFLAVMGTGFALIIPARLLGSRVVIGPTELRFTRGALGGVGPHLVTDRVPYTSVERFGFGNMPQDTDFSSIPNAIPTVLLRVAACPEMPRGGDVRIVLNEYPDAGRVVALLLRRIRRPPEPIVPGLLGLGRFR